MLELEELTEGVDAVSMGMVGRCLAVMRALQAIATHAGGSSERIRVTMLFMKM